MSAAERALRAQLGHLSWMSPPMGLALAVALAAALVYAVIAVRQWRALPLYWALAFAALAAGQVVARHGPRWMPVGDLALGTGLAICAAVYALLTLLRLWYTRARRARLAERSVLQRRERMHR